MSRPYTTECWTHCWIAYYENDKTRLSSGATKDEAVEALLTRDYPKEYGFKRLDSVWRCYCNNCPGVSGTGSSPGEAFADCKTCLETTWHPVRRNKLFKYLTRLAKAESNRCFGEADTEHYYRELLAYKKDLEDA